MTDQTKLRSRVVAFTKKHGNGALLSRESRVPAETIRRFKQGANVEEGIYSKLESAMERLGADPTGNKWLPLAEKLESVAATFRRADPRWDSVKTKEFSDLFGTLEAIAEAAGVLPHNGNKR